MILNKLKSWFQHFVNGYWPYLLLLLLGLVPLVWYRRGLVIAGGDNTALLNPGTLLPDFLHTWTDRINLGVPNLQTHQLFPLISFWVLLDKAGLSPVNIQRLWSVSLFLIEGLSIYFLFLQFFAKKENRKRREVRWGAVIAAAFYVLNVWVMIDAITPVMRLVQAVLPLLLLFWVKGLEGVSIIRYSFLLGLFSLLLASSFAHPVSAVSIPLSFLLYLVCYLLETRKFFHALKFCLLTVVFYLIFNAWWILPYFTSSLSFYSSAVKLLAPQNQYLRVTPIFEAFRFMGFWAFRNIDTITKIPHVPYAHYYYEPLFIILGYFLSVLALLALFFKPRNRYLVFLTLLGLTGVFLSKGANSPFGALYKLMFERVPGFSLFREPFARFTGIQVFSFSLLLGVSVTYLYSRIGQLASVSKNPFRYTLLKLIPLNFLAIVLLLGFPILNGIVIQDASWHNRVQEDLHIKVPDYWSQFNLWLKNNDPTARIMILPRQTYGNCLAWESGICTSGPVAAVLLNNPLIIYPESGFYYGDLMLRRLYELIHTGKDYDLSPLFKYFGVEYVLVQNDYIWYGDENVTPSTETLKTILTKQKSLSLKKTFGEKLDLYEYRDRKNTPPIQIPGSYELIDGQESLILDSILLQSGVDTGTFILTSDPESKSVKEVFGQAAVTTIQPTQEEKSNGRYKYRFSVPEDGEYAFYWKKDGTEQTYLNQHRYYLDGSFVDVNFEDSQTAPWFRFGKKKISTGTHFLEIDLLGSGNLFSPEAFFNAVSSYPEGSGFNQLDKRKDDSLFLTIPGDGYSKLSYAPFKLVSPAGTYKVSFIYKNVNGEFQHVGIQQYTCGFTAQNRSGFNARPLYGKGCLNYSSPISVPFSSVWDKFEGNFESVPGTKSAILNFQFEKPEETANVKDIKIEKILKASLLIKKTEAKKNQSEKAPEISYLKENPAKYRLFADNTGIAKEVILNQSYNQNWKIYPVYKSSIFKDGPIATYFLRPLPEKNHYIANGFANGWSLKVTDIDKTKELEGFIIEYRPELYYRIGLMTLTGGLLLMSINLLIRKLYLLFKR